MHMKLAIIFDGFNEATLGVYYKKAFEKLGLEVKHFWLRNSHEIEPVYDAYLRIDDGDYKYDIPHKRLKPSFFFASDVHLKKPFLAIKKAARFYDHVFCAQYSGYLKLKHMYGDKFSWLPHAYDSELHCDLNCGRKLDIAFIGNDGGIPRKFLLQEIRERFPNSYIGNAPHTDISRIYSSAKVGFNYSIEDDINMRTFEVMVCGAMLLTNHITDNGFGGLFADRKNLVTYKSPKEIFSMLEHYLQNDSEREKIAAEGKQLVTSSHSYIKRASFMLDTIMKYKGGKRA